MNLVSEVLLPVTVYGQASGRYDGSSLDFTGDPVRAVNYYMGQGSIQTVQLRVTGFVGRIIVESTLQDDPAAAAWFETYRTENLGTPISYYNPVTVTGNFTWMRVRIELFEAGTIDSIQLVY
jgi:hypothetical protein